MKKTISEGKFSLQTKQGTGLVGVISKHLGGIGFNKNSVNDRKRAHAVARALIEAFGGQRNPETGEYELNLHIGSETTVNVDMAGMGEALKQLNAKVKEAFGRQSERLEGHSDRIAELEAKVTALQAKVEELQATKANRRGRQASTRA